MTVCNFKCELTASSKSRWIGVRPSEDYLDFIQELQTIQAVVKEPDWPRTGHGGDSAN